jgi:hypothetical protein
MHPDKYYVDGSLVRTACHRMTDDEKRVDHKPEDGENRYNNEDVGPVFTLKLVLNSGSQLWLKFRP